MAPATPNRRPAAQRVPAQKAPAKNATARKATARKATARKAAPKRAASGKRPARQGPPKTAAKTQTTTATTPVGTPQVEVRRSRRRRRTVAAYREDDKVIVLIPARLSAAEERDWVATMIERLEKSEKRRRPSDAGLVRRAAGLNERYLDGLARPATVRWVTNQNSRWGSCTPSDRSIRLSTRLQGMPAWVIDYVLVHELAHLLETGHTARFWRWVDRFPKAERAKGFLEGVAAASALGIEADPPDCSAEGAAEMADADEILD